MASTSVTLHPRPAEAAGDPPTRIPNPLPPVLQTPAGLALLELQGTINLPAAAAAEDEDEDEDGGAAAGAVPVGRLDFPDYRPDAPDASSTAWMRRVYLYVGQNQRLTGEVRKLPRPVAVVRRRGRKAAEDGGAAGGGDDAMEGLEEEDDGEDGGGGRRAREEELEVVAIVRHKLVFSQRPEPVGATAAATAAG